MDNPNTSEDNWGANQSVIELHNGIEAAESPDHWDVNAAPNIPRLILPAWRSIKSAEMGLIMVAAMDTRRNMGNNKKLDRVGQYFFNTFNMLLDQEFHLEEFHGIMLSSRM